MYFQRGNPHCAADEALFQLGSVWYNVKARPQLQHFLQQASKLYKLEVYTFGTRAYASEVVKFIDPEGLYFEDRIVTRCRTHAAFSNAVLLRAPKF